MGFKFHRFKDLACWRITVSGLFFNDLKRLGQMVR